MGIIEEFERMSAVRFSGKLYQSFCRQATVEMNASLVLLNASYWCSNRNYSGLAKYFRAESAEERHHSLQFLDFVTLRGQFPVLDNLTVFNEPLNRWKEPLDLFVEYQQLEHTNLRNIEEIARIAQEEKDIIASAFLGPYILRQIESVSVSEELLAKAKVLASSERSIYWLDKELGKKSDKENDS
eukprot:TRINITY_DN8376_c0_g1_i1.p1 TRINITY_DN8376_c0_g1~~TRINITY_DN8376_c0_g1_i1.p1  ORF type:complete len:185 (+),score=38.24 TRINITY_DN8376_c0_g1_i1:99-653(+)